MQNVSSVHGQSPTVTLKALLEAGVHFGHQAKRWNPKMKPYIFTERNGIHIIDLQQTVPLLAAAHTFVENATARGGKILFVGTKKQAQDVVEREAKRSGELLRLLEPYGLAASDIAPEDITAASLCAE